MAQYIAIKLKYLYANEFCVRLSVVKLDHFYWISGYGGEKSSFPNATYTTNHFYVLIDVTAMELFYFSSSSGAVYRCHRRPPN